MSVHAPFNLGCLQNEQITFNLMFKSNQNTDVVIAVLRINSGYSTGFSLHLLSLV